MRLQTDRNRAKRVGRGIFAILEATLSGILLYLSVLPVIAQANSKNVLVLFTGFGNNAAWLNTIEPPIRARVPLPINFYESYLEVDADVENSSFWQIEAETLRRKYARKKLDLVLTDGAGALKFAVRYRDTIFPGVPIVFTAVSDFELPGLKKLPGMTGFINSLNLRETIDLALHLQPGTKAIAVISGVTAWDRLWLAATHAELLRYQDKIREVDIVGLPDGRLLEKVAALPPLTVGLVQIYPVFTNHPNVDDLLPLIGQRLPTYSAFESLCMNLGCIGGSYHDASRQLARTGEVVAQVLNGQRPEDIPISYLSDLQVRVDWRELQRWHIPESSLPAGSVILYRPPTLWEQYRRYAIAVIVVISALLLLIAGLLWERARKRKAEARLRESEKRFRVMAESTPSLVWMCDPEGKITYLNERRLTFTGPDPNAGYDKWWMEYVHPDDRKNVHDVVSQALRDRRAFSNEYRLRRCDGVYRWMFDVASPRLNGDGSFAGFIGSTIDVTDQKVAQQALEKVSGQLIEAQENERRRIARDLHDDICQRLALLSMELDQANRSANESDDTTKHRLKEIRQHCSEIAGDVQSLSHELHSSRLDYLGIVAAIRGFCHEFSKQHEVGIEFTDRDVPADLSRDVSLCLFRVTQEALHNAVKYSGIGQYAVELTATADEIQLKVSDAGRGFDVAAAKGNRGLGLVSMQERVHVVHGSLHVESEPGNGTKILAVVPLANGIQSSSDDKDADMPAGMIGTT